MLSPLSLLAPSEAIWAPLRLFPESPRGGIRKRFIYIALSAIGPMFSDVGSIFLPALWEDAAIGCGSDLGDVSCRGRKGAPR